VSSGEIYHELLIAGFGGQGIVLAGRLLATAALSEGREVVWAPSYGPEMRGGAVHCTIIVASERIGSPEVSQADSLLIMDNASMQKFAGRMKAGGLLIVNSSLVTVPDDLDAGELIRVPANEAAEALGDLRVANVIMLGAFLRVRPVVSPESLVGAMRVFAPKGKEHLIEINMRALERGAQLAATTGS
jgi:2-oxoglutarate ferredoxin oxidoreductase subunit gamma